MYIFLGSIFSFILLFLFRYEQLGYLEIDGTEIVEGQSPGTLKQLNTNNLLYLGKYEGWINYKRINSQYYPVSVWFLVSVNILSHKVVKYTFNYVCLVYDYCLDLHCIWYWGLYLLF